MDAAQWPKGIGVVKPMEAASRAMVERRARPQKDQDLNCPRCNSTNTKFCYYNNYSLSQPRYFCKTCRRYWTEGGSLRNVPVGGGSRKNKRSLSSSSSSPASSKKLGDLTPPDLPHSVPQNPKIHEGQDLNLGYPPPPTKDYTGLPKFVEVPFSSTCNKSNHQNSSSSSSTSAHLNAMELLKTGVNSRGLSSFMSMSSVSDSNTVYSSGFPMQDLIKPTLNFSLDGFETGYGNLQGVQESGARLLFPMEELKRQVPSTTNEVEQNRRQGESTGYWSGMLGGGGHW